jgi:hypothetical protein
LQNSTYEYDVALSYAGEDRAIAEAFSKSLESMGLSVFYDRSEQAVLWGSNLFEHLQHVYRDAARYCVIFTSHHYAQKRWTRHELKQAQERAFRDCGDYILPLRLDDTAIPGINETTGYIDARHVPITDIARLLYRKIRGEDYHSGVSAAEPDLRPALSRSHNGIPVPGFLRKHLSHEIIDQLSYLPNLEATSSVQLGQVGIWNRRAGQWHRSALGMIDEYFATDMSPTHGLTTISLSSHAEVSTSASGELSVELSQKNSFLLVGHGWRSDSIDYRALVERIAESGDQGLHWPSDLMIVTEVVMAESISLIWTESAGASVRLRPKGRALGVVPIGSSWEVVSRSESVGCELGLKERTPMFKVGVVKQGRRKQFTLMPYR